MKISAFQREPHGAVTIISSYIYHNACVSAEFRGTIREAPGLNSLNQANHSFIGISFLAVANTSITINSTED